MKTFTNDSSLQKLVNLMRLFLLIILFAGGFRAMAVNVYVDIDPDTLISTSGGFYNIDLNGDGTDDFKISLAIIGDYHTIEFGCLHDSSYVAYYFIECAHASAFNIGDSLTSSTPWRTGGANIANYGGITFCMNTGYFIGQLNKCLGVKLISGGITYYGWIRIEVGDAAEWFMLKDYGCDSQPTTAGYGILTGIRELDPHVAAKDHALRISPNPNQGVFTITPGNERYAVTVYTCLGSKVFEGMISEINKPDGRLIDIRQVPPGIYFVVIETDHRRVVEKIVVEHD